ncbi:MAG TPA: hypothetical protein ENL18_03155, partial [Thermoplasmatales archaeon]|nr:hypothetical protein [Thermoplasmatales archaeon]
MEIELKVGIKNTEDGARIRQALLNIFPDATVEEEGGIMAGVSRDAGNFKEMLKNQRIRDTARQFLSRRARNGMLSFKVNYSGLKPEAYHTGVMKSMSVVWPSVL